MVMPSMENLYRFPLFAGLDADTLRTMAIGSQEITLRRGERVFSEGDEANAIYVLLSGAVDLRLRLEANGGQEVDLERLVTGDTLGWSALVEPHIYTASAIAAENTRLLKFDARRISEMMEEDSEIGYKLMYRLAQIIKGRLSSIYIRFASLVEA